MKIMKKKGSIEKVLPESKECFESDLIFVMSMLGLRIGRVYDLL